VGQTQEALYMTLSR